jgi:thiamine-phosphate pyrophosphorylase
MVETRGSAMMRAVVRLYPIIDLPHPHGLGPIEQLEAIVRGATVDGIARVQLRGKGMSAAALREAAEAVGRVCLGLGVSLLVNDDLELALCGIDVSPRRTASLPAVGLAAFEVGVSTHDLAQLRAASAQRPDYVGFGPVAATRSKVDPDPVVGIDGLADACRVSRVPVVAIGGLDPSLAGQAAEVGAAMVAVIGGLVAVDADATAARAAAYCSVLVAASRWSTVHEVHARIPVLPVATLESIARWADDLSVLAGLRLPTRFAPQVVQGQVLYRPSDVCDLLNALGKKPDESWAQWHTRGEADHELVRLRSLGAKPAG